jgi:hypothetical protein
MKTTVGLAAALVLLLVLATLPLPLHPYLDFQVVYHADLGLLRGIPVYDHAGQVHMIAQLANVAPEQVFVVPFPYPPWYALVTVWLALLPIDLAARVWFGLNLIMLCLSLWMLTDGLPRARRLALALPAVIFPPVLGSLFVGQYAFPVLLGAVLLSWALQRKSALLVAVSAALLTFKPNLGGLILLIGAAYLWWRREDLGRRALPGLLITGAALFTLGFLASPAWPIEYVRSLTSFPGTTECRQCASLSVAFADALGGGFASALIAAAVLLVLLVAWLAKRWAQLAHKPIWLIGVGALMTLLVSPYLQNYDFVLLLVPFLVLGAEAHGIGWAWLALAYVLPFAALSLYGTAGNMSLVVSALILSVLMARLFSRTGERVPAPA